VFKFDSAPRGLAPSEELVVSGEWRRPLDKAEVIPGVQEGIAKPVTLDPGGDERVVKAHTITGASARRPNGQAQRRGGCKGKIPRQTITPPRPL